MARTGPEGTGPHRAGRKGNPMGSGRWCTDVYSAAAHFRAASGTSAFAYSDSGASRVHPALDPRDAMRESRDSAEHPRSLAIAVLFDVTGSSHEENSPRNCEKCF